MTDTATLNHAARILAALGPEMPADLALRRYLAEARHLGPRERRSISRAMFSFFRWWRWLDTRDSLQKQVEQALALNEQFVRNANSVKPETLAARAVPDWLRGEMDLPADFLRQLQRKPTLWLRARPGTAGQLAADLKDCEMTPRSPDALRYAGARDLFLTPQFHAGAFEIQDLASQCVGGAAAPQPGQTWWDACAGEGGKTLHLADLMQNRGLVWASDRSVRRLEVLKHRAARAKLFNYRTAPWDGIRLPTKTKFDGVLLDAPCSGVGTWRRNPHARWTVTPEDVRELAGVQSALLAKVAEAVKPGGRLIYAVCTLTRSETTSVAAAFAAARPDFESADGAPQFLWPQDLDADGMFIAAWRRKRKIQHRNLRRLALRAAGLYALPSMVSDLTDRQWLWCAAGLYLAGFLLGNRSLLRGGRPSGLAMYGLIAIGYLLQNLGLGLRGRAVGGCPLGNTFEFVQFTAWSAISLYLVVGVTFRSSLFGYLTSVLGAALTLSFLSVPAWDATRRAHIFGGNAWIEFHAALALFSYGVFALLSLTSVLFLLRLYSLQNKRIGGWFSFLPSILDLDHIGLRLLIVGVVLLGVSLAVGSVYWLRDTESVGTPKLLITIGVWAAYAAALGLRLRGWLLAKRFAWTCAALFLAALASLGPVNASRHPAPVETVRLP